MDNSTSGSITSCAGAKAAVSSPGLVQVGRRRTTVAPGGLCSSQEGLRKGTGLLVRGPQLRVGIGTRAACGAFFAMCGKGDIAKFGGVGASPQAGYVANSIQF